MEHETGPGLKKFFQKIINSIFYGVMWMIAVATAGIYFKLGWKEEGTSVIYVIIFYVIALSTFFFLIRYLYRTWKD